MAALRLSAPPDAPFSFIVELEAGSHPGAADSLTVAEGSARRTYGLGARQQDDYLDLFAAVARDFGTRAPLARQPLHLPPDDGRLTPRLTEAIAPEILYGYGDPSVLRVLEPDGGFGWRMVVTSNDAPDVFPILSSRDLDHWRLAGFAFPQGHAPAWTLTGENLADFWAPEMHRVGQEYWLCYAARQKDRALAIGLARAAAPEGPFVDNGAPLIGGGVIDPHIVQDASGAPFLLWKEDNNAVWPRRLIALLRRRGALIAEMFGDAADQRTASLLAALWGWGEGLEPMEQFFVLQPLIEAAADDFATFEARLAELRDAAEPDLAGEITAVREATKTKVFAQHLSRDGARLEGERIEVLQNDLPWEAHLIEGVWVSEVEGRYVLLYAANDFSTPAYGVGVAVADAPLGPYRKAEAPLLRSTAAWVAPGHPSIAPGSDGRPLVFLHAYRPGELGYKAFRALLTTPLTVPLAGLPSTG